MKKAILFLTLCALVSFAFADPMEEEFSNANQKYAEGNYEEGIASYEKLIESGVSSGALYYNLGNAYFKLGRIGKAILNYERGKRLTPQDEDLLANLTYVKGLIEQAQPVDDYPITERAFLRIRDLLSVNGWTVALLSSFNFLFCLWLFAILSQGVRRRAAFWSWVFVTLTAASFVFTFSKISAQESAKEGIIVQNVADVRYSPSLKGAVAFQLKEGIFAQILRCDGDFCYIRLTRDKIGWLERKAIEEI